jgi:hypothetical protein
MGHACDHPPRPRQLDPGLTGGWQRLLSLAPPPDHQPPSDAPFHHPAARQHLHATRARWRCRPRSSPAPANSSPPVLNALQRPTPWCGHPRSACPSVGTANGPPVLQAGPLAVPRRPPPLGAVAVRTIGRRHEHPDEQAWRLHQDMARAPRDCLPPSIAPGGQPCSRSGPLGDQAAPRWAGEHALPAHVEPCGARRAGAPNALARTSGGKRATPSAPAAGQAATGARYSPCVTSKTSRVACHGGPGAEVVPHRSAQAHTAQEHAPRRPSGQWHRVIGSSPL